MKIVYVAAPYSSGDQVINVRNAINAGEELVKNGFVPFVPHLSHLWHCISPHEYDFWINLDTHYLLRCDALLRLPGESRGADSEVAIAIEKWIPVYYSIPELVEGLSED